MFHLFSETHLFSYYLTPSIKMSPACFTCSQAGVLSTMTNAYWDILHLLLSTQVNLEHVCFANQKLLVCEKCADLLRDIGKFQEDAVNSVKTQIRYWENMEPIKKEPVEIEVQIEYEDILPDIRIKEEPSENLVITPDIVKLERDSDLGHCHLSDSLNGEALSEMSSLMTNQATMDTSGLNNWMVNTYGQMTCDVNLDGAGDMEGFGYSEPTFGENDTGADTAVPAQKKITTKNKKIKKTKRTKNKALECRARKGQPAYLTRTLSSRELRARREALRGAPPFATAPHRCASCIQPFGSAAERRAHRLQYHQKKASYMECRICQRTLPPHCLIQHVTAHHRLFECPRCQLTTHDLAAVQDHPCKKRKKTRE